MRRSHHVDHRGNTHDRRVRRDWMFDKFRVGAFVPCTWCGKRMRRQTFEVDRHPDPRGTYARGNIVPACRRCNARRGQKLPPVPPTTTTEERP